MKKQRRTIGAIVKIPLKDRTHGYGLVLDKASIAVFKIRTTQDLEVDTIINEDILFIVAVYNDAITSGRWEKIGKVDLDERFQNLPLKFIQDSMNPDKVEIYNPNTRNIQPATKEECLKLERAAVWEAQHVEERILDYFNGKENIWVNKLQLK